MAKEMADSNRPVVLVHGYSDQGKSFVPWAKLLKERGFKTETIGIVTYKSLTNEVTIKDLAEGFERALQNENITGPFDAIVHSTGMLVVRAWLTANRDDLARRNRLRHLIGFAPATWGSPLAHRGRGFLGSIFKGNKETDAENAPDFLEAGDRILDGLELGSAFTWELAHRDLFGKDDKGNDVVFFGTDENTPYPFIFCGNRAYENLLRRFINEPGTDGTVRFAGVSLNSRKFLLDLTKKPGEKGRFDPAGHTNVDAPVIFVADRDHGSILSDPDETMANLVVAALNVDTAEKYKKWVETATAASKKPKTTYQQFVIHMTDERGDPINDYHVELFTVKNGHVENLPFDLDMHPYQADKSYRCFHVDLDRLRAARAHGGTQVWMRVTLSSGTILMAYRGFSNEGLPKSADSPRRSDESEEQHRLRLDSRPTEIDLNLTPFLDPANPQQLFFDFTTTLVEMKVDREPLPFEKIARLCYFEKLNQFEL